jgi:hypothetical protein
MPARFALDTDRTEVISGESIQVRATIDNPGASPVTIPTRTLSPVVYTLRPLASTAPAHVVSQVDDTEMLRAGRPAPALPREDEPVLPGEAVTYDDNVALYAQDRLPPARYRVTATCNTSDGPVEAALPEIDVQPARIGGASTLHCFYSHVQATAFSHTAPDRTVWIFQEETRTQELRTGVFYRRHQLPAGSDVSDVAVAVHTRPRIAGRWVGWIRDHSFSALCGWGDALTGLVDPVALELDAPRLVPPGFQDGDETCLFLIAGERDGATWLVSCAVSEPEASVGAPVKLCDGRPRRILARGYEADARTGGMDVAWSETHADGGTELHAVSCAPDGRPLPGSSRLLHRRRASLLAWDLEPYGATAVGAVHALFGPESGDRRLIYVRAPLDGRTAALETPLPPLPPELTGPLQASAISGLEPGLMRIAAIAAGSIWTGSALDGGWMKLADAPGARDLTLVTTPYEAYWGVVWVDPASGSRYAADPEFIR